MSAEAKRKQKYTYDILFPGDCRHQFASRPFVCAGELMLLPLSSVIPVDYNSAFFNNTTISDEDRTCYGEYSDLGVDDRP